MRPTIGHRRLPHSREPLADDLARDLWADASLSLGRMGCMHPGTVFGSQSFAATRTLVVENTGNMPLHISPE